MSSQIEQTFNAPPGKYLVDTYEDWARGEGIPIHSGQSLDLHELETKPWPRFGVKGAFCHLDGRCDFLTVFLLEIGSGERSAPQRHLYEELCLVIAGAGTTEIELADRSKRTIDWSPGSLFATPMNATYRHCCASAGTARIACVNDLRYLLNLYRNESFLFRNPLGFPERGTGEAIADMNHVPQAGELHPHELTTPLSLAHGSIAADVVEIPSGVYGTARRQMFGALLFGVSGSGQTQSWDVDVHARSRCAWRPGAVLSLAGMTYHQHFNMGQEPARFLKVEFGSAEFPMLRSRRREYGDRSVYASGASEIDFSHEAPEIRGEWLSQLARLDVPSRM